MGLDFRSNQDQKSAEEDVRQAEKALTWNNLNRRPKMSTTGIENWALDLKDVAQIYPFQGSEGFLFIIGLVTWIGWHIWCVNGNQLPWWKDSTIWFIPKFKRRDRFWLIYSSGFLCPRSGYHRSFSDYWYPFLEFNNFVGVFHLCPERPTVIEAPQYFSVDSLIACSIPLIFLPLIT